MAKVNTESESLGWLWTPVVMLVVLGVELLAITLVWGFPIQTWTEAGTAGSAILTSLVLTSLGIAGVLDPSTEISKDIIERESVHIDGRQATISRVTGKESTPIGRLRAVLFLIGGVLLFLAIAFLGVHQARRLAADKAASVAASARATVAPARPAPPRTAPRPAPPAEQPKVIASWREAIANAKPTMTDTLDQVSPGAKLLASYAAAHPPTWAELDVKPQTTIGRVLKDADEERTRPLCASGTIKDITKQVIDGHKVFAGMLATKDQERVGFLAVRSTGELVERSRARLCGVVTGSYDYKTTGGGVARAAFVVGMFDLPENR